MIRPPSRHAVREWMKRHDKRTKRKRMTVCIASLCENGGKIVAVTDGALTLGGVTSDVLVAGKMLWLKDWLFLWAGEPGNVDLVIENVRHIVRQDRAALTRENIRRTVNRAFREFAAEWATDNVLPAYNMDMAEFKKKGRHIFGDPLAGEIAKKMNEAVKGFLLDELLVIGWGKTGLSALLHQRSVRGSSSHALSGSAAIGIGCDVALSTLLLLGQSRNSTLEETIYSVAAAKFMAEKSEEDAVGKLTTMFIGHKRIASDTKIPGIVLLSPEIKKIRDLWDQYGKPQIPGKAMTPIVHILRENGMPEHQPSMQTMARILQSGSKVPDAVVEKNNDK
jgi:hypothetical protein